MGLVTLSICEACGAEQRSDTSVYWASSHADCSWVLPNDGINGGRFNGRLCVRCRCSILAAVEKTVASVRETKK